MRRLILEIDSRLPQPEPHSHRGLLWLHDQEMIRLNKGLAVFPPAMAALTEAGKSGLRPSRLASLHLHHYERVRQIHAMAEYAQHGPKPATDHLNLTMDYFRACSHYGVTSYT